MVSRAIASLDAWLERAELVLEDQRVQNLSLGSNTSAAHVSDPALTEAAPIEAELS